MESMLVMVGALHVNPGRQAEFAEYESAASRIMRRYGGTIERRIVFYAIGKSQPNEVHIVTFPDQVAFERCRLDPEILGLGLAELRLKAIRLRKVWPGVDRPIHE